MVIFIWLVLFAVFVLFLYILIAFSRRVIYERYSGARPVACPKDQQQAVVGIDLEHAAATSVDGAPDLRLSECTYWPERANCKQECMSQALQAEPYKEVSRKPGRKQIYHLPVLLAAFAAWYAGMLWHSHYLFREKWTSALGLTPAQIKQTVWWLSPHIVTACAALLFAYGVAWLLAIFHRKGILQGVLMAVLLSGSVIATTWFDIERLPHDLFVIEAGYAALAIVIVGTVVGGLYDKLVLRSH